MHVIPLLVETGQTGAFDRIVVVDVDPATQRERLLRRDGFTEAEADRRLAAQATRSDRLAAADVVLDNHGSVTQLQRQIRDLWNELNPADART